MKLGGRVIYRLEDVLAFENQELRDLEEIKAGCQRRRQNRPRGGAKPGQWRGLSAMARALAR